MNALESRSQEAGVRSHDVARPLSVIQLRMLVRNDEARIEHLTQWINGMRPGDLAPVDMQERIDAAHASLVEHSTALRLKLSPAASSLVIASPSGGAAQPE